MYIKAYKIHGSQRLAAESLGISRSKFRTLYKKELGLCITWNCESKPKVNCTRCQYCLDKARDKRPKEDIYKSQKEWRTNKAGQDPEYFSKKQKEYYKLNIESIREYQNNYSRSRKEYNRLKRQKSRHINKLDMKLTEDSILSIINKFDNKCFNCSSSDRLELDHNLPIILGGKLEESNVVVLCKSCNSKKRSKMPENFYNKDQLFILKKYGIDKKKIHIPKKLWQLYSESEVIKAVYEYIITRGYPYYLLSIDDNIKEIEKLNNYCDNNEIIVDGIIRSTQHGQSVCWQYFPHHLNVKCNNNKTVTDILNSEYLIKKAIKNRLKRGTYITESGIRKMLRGASGVQCVSNFRPSAARAIYDRYAGGGVVWDMSGGWGGRMLGAISSPKVNKYITTEPSIKSAKGLYQLAQNCNMDIYIISTGSEKYIPEEEVDLCFTSPPYFDCEKYSNEDSQSYLAYPNKDLWLNNFMGKTLENCHKCLKSNGHMILNVDNVSTYKELVKDVIKIAYTKGFKLITTLKYSQSNISNPSNTNYEPVLIFKKQ